MNKYLFKLLVVSMVFLANSYCSFGDETNEVNNLDEIFNKTLSLVKEAGEILKNINDDKKVTIKQDGTFVTKYDLEIDKKLTDGLKKITDCSVLSEEHKEEQKNTYYIIDPIDGTHNFNSGSEIFGIIVALVRDKKTLFSIIHLPILEKTYTAKKGKGAYLNGEKINVKKSSTDYLFGSMFLSKNSLNTVEDILNSGEKIDLRCMGCAAYEFGQVASGVFDFFFFKNAGNVWDFIGPKLVIEEAGGILKYKKYGDVYNVIGGTKEAVEKLEKITKIIE